MEQVLPGVGQQLRRILSRFGVKMTGAFREKSSDKKLDGSDYLRELVIFAGPA